MPYRREIDRQQSGSSLMEVATASLVLIPIVLLMVDVAAMLMIHRSNQELAHNAARSAANKRTPDAAEQAAQYVLTTYPASGLIANIKLINIDFSAEKRLVSVTTELDGTLPVPMPGCNSVHFTANAQAPIVAIPAPI